MKYQKNGARVTKLFINAIAALNSSRCVTSVEMITNPDSKFPYTPSRNEDEEKATQRK